MTCKVFMKQPNCYSTNIGIVYPRRVSVSLSDLVDADTYQMSLFDNKEQQRAIDKVVDDIKDRFGEISILRASSLTTAGLARDRALKIGGHYK